VVELGGVVLIVCPWVVAELVVLDVAFEPELAVVLEPELDDVLVLGSSGERAELRGIRNSRAASPTTTSATIPAMIIDFFDMCFPSVVRGRRKYSTQWRRAGRPADWAGSEQHSILSEADSS
jgi:hypothetical protein